MSISYGQHFLLALWAVLTGMGLGFVYEWFRVLHAIHPRSVLLIFIEDLVFSLLCAVSLTVLFFNLSYGRMRFYGFVLCIAGFILWYFTAGQWFRKWLRAVSRVLKPPVQRVRELCSYRIERRKLIDQAHRGFGAQRILKRAKPVSERKGHKNVPST